jgi:LysM repeat protein
MSRTLPTEPSRLFRRLHLGWVAGVALALAPAAVRAQVPETHTVKSGDTLWDLARQYLKDPFLWPEIYRLNTLVVEDPHWIYPGEVLRLAPSEKATAVPQADTTPSVSAAPAPAEARPGIVEVPSDTMTAAAPAPNQAELPDTTSLFPAARGQVRIALTAGELPARSPVHRSDFHSSGFLTEGDELPFGRLIGPVTPPQIPTQDPRGAATLYTKVALTPPAGATYQVGDTLLLVAASHQLEGYGRIVEPRGLARVVSESEGTPIAEVIAVYGEILPDQSVLPAEKFPDLGTVRPAAVSDGIQASVIGWPGRRELKGSGIVLFLDKGKRDGVALGDMFEVRRAPGRQRNGMVTIAEVMATVQVVHVRERTATVRVLGVSSPDVPRGTHAFQVAKLPS